MMGNDRRNEGSANAVCVGGGPERMVVQQCFCVFFSVGHLAIDMHEKYEMGETDEPLRTPSSPSKPICQRTAVDPLAKISCLFCERFTNEITSITFETARTFWTGTSALSHCKHNSKFVGININTNNSSWKCGRRVVQYGTPLSSIHHLHLCCPPQHRVYLKFTN